VTSGRRLAESEVYAVQRLASYKNADDGWLLSVEDIAQQLNLHHATVTKYIREGCRRWHHLTRWHTDDSQDTPG
jgi:IS30 family transposase